MSLATEVAVCNAANKLTGTLVPSLGKLNLTLLVLDSNLVGMLMLLVVASWCTCTDEHAAGNRSPVWRADSMPYAANGHHTPGLVGFLAVHAALQCGACHTLGWSMTPCLK